MLTISISWLNITNLKWACDGRIEVKIKILLDGCRKMFDQSLSKFEDLGDMLRFLPGVIVQNPMSLEAMADLYRIKQHLLDRLVKPPIKALKSTLSHSGSYLYSLDEYLSCFLQDPNRCQLYYCGPILQHISICRNFLSLLDLCRDASFRGFRDV